MFFGKRNVLDEINFEINKGEIFGMLGFLNWESLKCLGTNGTLSVLNLTCFLGKKQGNQC